MIQAFLMLLAPASSAADDQNGVPVPVTWAPPNRRMATRPAAHNARSWRRNFGFGLAIAGNALGLLVFLAGLGMILRLGEVLLS
jgi:hypothetical protein